MPRFLTRPALALLGALLCLAACAPTATVSVVPTATATATPAPTATPTPTPVLAPTPTNVPAGWAVLATPHFSLAYPSGWTTQPPFNESEGFTDYGLRLPDKSALWVEVLSPLPAGGAPPDYCSPASDAVRHTTFAGLPMTFSIQGEGGVNRTWAFANAQRTVYLLGAGDAQASSATQAQDEAILATFRPDNATPWKC